MSRLLATLTLAGLIVCVTMLGLSGCGGGAANESNGSRSEQLTTPGGRLAVSVTVTQQNNNGVASVRAARARSTSYTLRVHAQAGGVDLVSPVTATVQDLSGTAVTVTFPYVPASVTTILVELLDANGSVVTTGTGSVALPTNQTNFDIVIPVSLVVPSSNTLTLLPATATVSPCATPTFTASGGSGTGYVYSISRVAPSIRPRVSTFLARPPTSRIPSW